MFGQTILLLTLHRMVIYVQITPSPRVGVRKPALRSADPTVSV
jgi:hypothetical protein